VDEFYDSASAWLLWILMLPGVLPLIALALLVFGFPRARRVRRPGRYRIGLIVTAAALVCFSLVPTYAKYIHARRVNEEWFWQALGLIVPFLLLLFGLNTVASADRTPRRRHFWNAL
jgi:hypothetical protein